MVIKLYQKLVFLNYVNYFNVHLVYHMTQEKQLGKLIKKNKGEGVHLAWPQIIGYNFYYIYYDIIQR